MNKFVFFCVILLVVKKASTLSCDHCSDEVGWESCQAKVQVGQCDPIIATDLHRNLQNLNPNLPVTPVIGFYSYQCFKLAVKFKIAQGSSSVMYEQGCTFSQAKFCDGWDRNILEQVNCSTSSTGVPDVDDGAVDPEYNESDRAGSQQLSGSFCSLLMVMILTLCM